MVTRILLDELIVDRGDARLRKVEGVLPQFAQPVHPRWLNTVNCSWVCRLSSDRTPRREFNEYSDA